MLRDMDHALAKRHWLAADAYSVVGGAFTPYAHRLKMLGLARLWDVGVRFERHHLALLILVHGLDRVDVPQGSLTGALHHIALRLKGYEEVKSQLDAHRADDKLNFVQAISLRQIFTADLNNVLLKLNFFAE